MVKMVLDTEMRESVVGGKKKGGKEKKYTALPGGCLANNLPLLISAAGLGELAL